MRVFIAISPPEEIRSEVQKIISDNEKKFPQIRWESSDKLHLTLAFLGMLKEEKVNILRDILYQAVSESNSFELELGEISYFYKKHDDPIIYVDVIDRDKKLREFYKTLRRQLAEKDILLPERLTPHISIGRLKRTRHAHEVKENLLEFVRSGIRTQGNFKVNSINLYQSLFSKYENTSNYHLIQSFSLGETPKLV